MKNKILSLSYNDFMGDGHAFATSKELKELGFEVFFLPYIRKYSDVNEYFIDTKRKWNYSNIKILIISKLRYYFSLLNRTSSVYCYFSIWNASVSAKKILRKCPFKPDYIYIGWHDFYLSPKTIYDLYRLSGAEIILSMVDAYILGGGCHYPFDCKQYMAGCKKCPALKYNKWLSIKLYNKKIKYWTDMPMHIVGTTYDIERALNVPFLSNKVMHKAIGVPEIPFLLNKHDARKMFGIENNGFVIMFGAAEYTDKRKGLKILIDALKIFAKENSNKRKISLLVIGHGNTELIIDDRINVITTGYLKLQELFSAFYASDVYISPSLDDSGPYMINYSIACGRPVISFPIGIAKDLVLNGETGYLAKFNNEQDIANGLNKFYMMDIETINKYSINCKNLMSGLLNKHWYDFLLTE